MTHHIIRKNGIPDHKIGIFPMTDDPGGCARPNGISEAFEQVTFPLPPTGPLGAITWLTVPTPCVGPDCPNEESYVFGIAVNGVVFDPLANEWWEGQTGIKWNKNALLHPDMATDLDCNMAHIQPNGRYHYHGLPTGLYESLGGTYPWIPSASAPGGLGVLKTFAKTVQLGWAFDGVPIYGPLCYVQTSKKLEPNWSKPKSIWALKTGTRPIPPAGPGGNYDGSYSFYPDPANPANSTGDYQLPNPVPASSSTTLDECNGHFAPTPDYPDGIYHYHITEEYPYIPHCFHYTPNVNIEPITNCLPFLPAGGLRTGKSGSPSPTPSIGHTPPISPMPRQGVTPLDRLSPKPKPTP